MDLRGFLDSAVHHSYPSHACVYVQRHACDFPPCLLLLAPVRTSTATARVTSCLACASLLSRARAGLLVHDGAASWQAVREMGEAAWHAEALRIAYEVADGMAYLHLRYADATVYICRHTHHTMA